MPPPLARYEAYASLPKLQPTSWERTGLPFWSAGRVVPPTTITLGDACG